jgi:acyl dehydratase
MTVSEATDGTPDAEVLPALPSSRQQLWKALRTLTRTRTAAAIPRMSVEVPALRADAPRLAAYRTLCGFRDEGVPVTFPQVQALRLQIHLLTRREFPLPLLGAVHLRNTIAQLRPIEADKHYRVRVELLGGRTRERGVEFDVATRYYDGQRLVWESVATALYRARGGGRGGTRGGQAKDPLERLQERATFDATTDIGRRYGRVSGDRNPIHLWRLGGRLFGLPGHIAHGMWSLARCVALLNDSMPEQPFDVAVDFKQPLVLPSRVSLLAAAANDGLDFALAAHDRSRLHLFGSIRLSPAPVDASITSVAIS